MFLDLLGATLLVLAVIKGYQRGLIVAVFSLVAIIIGLAAAIKLSAAVAVYIGDTVNVSQQWLPFISFAVVFIGVVLLVRLGANLIQKTVEWGMLGWINRLGGILLYVITYFLVYSVVLFYADQLGLLKPETREASLAYEIVSPWGPRTIDTLGVVIPFFKDMFNQLQSFFGNMTEGTPA